MNTIFNASAGTGKTYQVTQLYEKLVLEDHIDPREILLMTFTDNAAAELRMRVAHRLLKARRTAESEDNYELTERAIAATAKLASAPIGTIHSFCTRLLRENALEAGLSPGFAVLVGDERDELLNRICRDELLNRLENDPDFKVFCSGAHMIGSAGGFGSSITETVPNLIAQAGSLGILLENAESLLPAPQSGASLIDFEIIVRRITELPKITPAVQTALNIIRQALDETDAPESLVERMDQLGIKKFGRGAKEISDDFWALKESVIDAQRYRERFPAARAFARYAQAVARQFLQAKHRMNAVDFDDQLRAAEKLLRSGNARQSFRYVIVDEVQDTSRIQSNIIQALWSDETNLVICGDKKQSIYTWRGADPQVMPDLEKAILKNGGTQEILQTSYRSKGPVLDVVNALFESVYGPDGYSGDDQLKTNPDFSAEGEKPCVEFLAPDDDEERPKQEKVTAEMTAIANRIHLLTKGESQWQPVYRHSGDGFDKSGQDNAYRYSDILILLRRMTHLPELEQALRHNNIPYTLGGKGRGLFTRQETRDVSLFLNVLTNPLDAWSLVGLLRSPWVGLSDEQIAELAWSSKGFSAERLLKQQNEATDIIDRYRALLGTNLASELVRMLIEETGYDALLAGLPRGTQRLANLRKVLDWLRTTERGPHTTTAAVARKLADQIAHPPQIPEAVLLDPAQNAVTIMTVHGAKGLTKRVVFVPDMSFSDKNDTSFAQVFFDEQKNPKLGLRITAPNRSSVKSPGFDAASKRAAATRRHELNNLFYVAMTRARDLVVTSASTGKKAAGWLLQMEPLIGKEIPATPYSALQTDSNIAMESGAKQPTAQKLQQALSILPPPPDMPELQRIPATQFAKQQDEVEPLHEQPDVIRPSTTTAALGSLGHAVLEQLALNQWEGDPAAWLEKLRPDFSIGRKEAASLLSRIETARRLMKEKTEGMQELRPEFPFVLHHEGQLIDGTIDLLCRMPDGFAVFDYKFTETAATDVANLYRGQLDLYRRAAEKFFPYAGTAQTELIVISKKEVKTVPIRF